MEAIFVKLPNFEPLMEQFVPEKDEQKTQASFDRRRFFKMSKRFQSHDPRQITMLEKGITSDSNLALIKARSTRSPTN